ncbi:hypothetical protein B6D52_02335 [Candidatus Parcubacteria bacterium 4484_255]|nr:MAG: hypothetical protein B6D52_02335 [Candidatus Parcubacteria bacterium 4484_255]
MPKLKKQKVGLVLSSGGVKGYAHIGVIKTLTKNQIPIDIITGASAGAMIGALYSLFLDIEKIEKMSLSNSWKRIVSFIDLSFRKGLIRGKKIQTFLNKIMHNATFEQTKIPLNIVATDFNTAQTIEIQNGNIASAVRASISVPLLFEPIELNGDLLCDGGLSNPVPVNVARKMGADIIIAVNLDNSSYFDKNRSFIAKNRTNRSMILESLYCLQYHLAKKTSESADILIEPKVDHLGIISWNKFLKNRGKNIITKGEKATEIVLPQIKKLLS